MIAFEQGAETGKIENAASGKRAIQSKIALEMLALNKEQAITTMKAWAKFAELGSGRQHQTHFKTEAEYIAYRMVDIGTMSAILIPLKIAAANLAIGSGTAW